LAKSRLKRPKKSPRPKHKRLVSYRSALQVSTQAEALREAQRDGIGLVMADDDPKMAVFRCPSGCGEILRINLMPEMGRAWRLRLDSAGRVTLYPSVALTAGCRAHFVLTANKARVLRERLGRL
jgi:hypothetical protein